MNEISLDRRGHPARRKEITDAARALAAESGWAAVTLRAVAARVGCSAPAIYQYFRDKDAILAALAAEGHATLSLRLDDAIADVSGPAKRLRAAVRVLWDFALVHPEFYSVMYGVEGVAAHRGSHSATPAMFVEIARDLVSKREASQDAVDLADRVAATAQGFIGLSLADGFPGGRDRALALLTEVIEDIIKGIKR